MINFMVELFNLLNIYVYCNWQRYVFFELVFDFFIHLIKIYFLLISNFIIYFKIQTKSAKLES